MENYNVLSKDGHFQFLQKEVDSLNTTFAEMFSCKEKESVKHARKALLLSRKIDYKKGMADAFVNLGKFHIEVGDYVEAIKNFKKSILIYDLLNNTEKIGEVYNSIGEAYYLLGNYDKGMEFFLKLLEIAKYLKNTSGVSLASNNIGTIFYKLEIYKKALKYYTDSLHGYEELQDEQNVVVLYNNIGLIYIKLGDLKNAAVFLGKAFNLSCKTSNKKGVGLSLNHIGKIYLKQKKYLLVIKILSRALSIFKELNDDYFISDIKNRMGIVYLQMSDMDLSYVYLNESMVLAKRIGYKDIIIRNYQNLAELFSQRNNYRKAFDFLRLFLELKEQMHNESFGRKIAELTARYEVEKKEREVDLYRSKNVELLKANLNLQKANQIINQKNRELQNAHVQLELLARTDPLTGLLNRRSILEKIEDEVVRYERHKIQFVVIICDIDKFKKFNDQFGHECGDHVLVSIGEHLKSILRNQDEVARWGGEEFLLMLPETNLESGKKVAEMIRTKIFLNRLVYQGAKFSVTMTFGVSVFDGSCSIAECIKRADLALYRGKNNGRNCVVSEQDS